MIQNVYNDLRYRLFRVINVNVRKTKEVNYDRFIIKKGQNIIWNDGL